MKDPMPITSEASPAVREVLQLLQSVIDPEAGISIVDMGLVYDVDLHEDGVTITMTMTSAACPMADLIIEEVAQCLRPIFPVPANIEVKLTFDPPWAPDKMSESARAQFGW